VDADPCYLSTSDPGGEGFLAAPPAADTLASGTPAPDALTSAPDADVVRPLAYAYMFVRMVPVASPYSRARPVQPRRSLWYNGGAMAFTVRDFHDLVGLLQQHPEWRAELRRLVLSDEILSLPEVVRQIAEQIRALAEAQKRTEQRVEELAEAQKRTEETIRFLVGEVASLKGESLERRYRERAASYFQRILRRIRLVDHQQLGLLLDDAVDAGRITLEEREDLLETDVVVAGLHDDQQVYLVAEVAGLLTFHDVERALRRAAAAARALDRPALAAIAGERLSGDLQTLQQAARLWRVLDGRTERPSPAP
jgi:hypothetical protein